MVEKLCSLPASPDSASIFCADCIADGSMPVAFTSRADCHIGYSIPVRLQNLNVAEYLVSESVQAIQRDSNISCCHPFLL